MFYDELSLELSYYVCYDGGIVNIIFISYFFTIYRKDGGGPLLEGSR